MHFYDHFLRLYNNTIRTRKQYHFEEVVHIDLFSPHHIRCLLIFPPPIWYQLKEYF